MKRVFLDPDGTFPPGWKGVIVSARTGILYVNQCAGVACEQRKQEGYYVPLGRTHLDKSDGSADTEALTSPFHLKRGCDWSRVGLKIPPDCVEALEAAIARIPFWISKSDGTDERGSLRLDRSRIAQAAEAWVPVLTPDGPGILVWENCD